MKERSPKPQSLAKQIVASAQGRPAAGRNRAKRPSRPAGVPRDWPETCGAFDIRIDGDGVWHYQGSPIGRIALVKLFATVLRRDAEGGYWLVTPAEAGRIEVEDVPFTAVELSATGSGASQTITLRTNVDDIVTVDAEHPIRVEHDPESGEPRPYVLVRDGLEARLLRPVYYHLVELGVEEGSGDDQIYGVWSGGHFFPLGELKGGA